MILTLAWHEFRRHLKTGYSWKLLALNQCILGHIFYWLTEDLFLKAAQGLFEHTGALTLSEGVVHPLLAWQALLLFLILPLLAAETLTHERKAHILPLLLLSPLSQGDIILSKFLSVLFTSLLLMFPLLLMPFGLSIGNFLEMGSFLSGILGLIALSCAALSLSFLVAVHCKEPLVAILFSMVSLFLLSLLEWASQSLGPAGSWLSELSPLYHCKNFLSGILYTPDILYYAVFSSLCLYFSICRLKCEPYFRKGLL